MIAGIFHKGSGLGNQLFRYVTTRTLAEDKGYEWGMLGNTSFKGKDIFPFINYGKEPMLLPVALKKDGCPFTYGTIHKSPFMGHTIKQWNEKKVTENGVDIRSYDPEINFVEDSTIIDGEFQDERYWGHRLNEIREWLKVESLKLPDDLCVISHRGGEYTLYPDLYLQNDYWDKAIALVRENNPDMKFQVQTDDPISAQKQFPDFVCIHDIGYNWRAIRYAKHLILGNTSFAILPALLNENVGIIYAPRYWARHNTKVWALPQNYYKRFSYV